MERALLINLGPRTYRKYPVNIKPRSKMSLPMEKLQLLELDDGEGSDEENNFYVSSGAYEEIMEELKTEFQYNEADAQHGTVTETIYCNSRNKTYSIHMKISSKQLMQGIFGTTKGRGKVQGTIEKQTKCKLVPNFKSNYIEIRGKMAEYAIKAYKLLMEHMGKPEVAYPQEYNVIDEVTRENLQKIEANSINEFVFDADNLNEFVPKQGFQTQAELQQLNEFPVLLINKQQGKYIHLLRNVPNKLRNYLLENKGLRIKNLQNDGAQAKFYYQRNTNTLEITGKREDIVRQGYANLIKMIKGDPDLYQQIHKDFQQNEYTHFLAINLKFHPIISALSQSILSSKIQNYDQQMGIPPHELHMTLGMLAINNIPQFIQDFQQCKDEIIQEIQGGKIVLTFDRLECFGSPEQANVLYLKPAQDYDFITLKKVN